MRHGGWVARRTGVRTRLLVSLTALTFTITLLITGIVGLVQSASVTGVRHYLADVDDTAATVQFSTSLADDPAAQNAALNSLSDRLFGDLPVQHLRRLKSVPYTLTAPGADGQSAETTVRLGGYDDFAGNATITAGRWPAAGGADVIPVAVPAAVAQRWKLTVGDRIEAAANGGAARKLQVAAIFTATPGPFWRADVALVNQQSVADLSPTLVVADEILTEQGSSADVGWIFQVVTDRVTPDQVAGLQRSFAALTGAVTADFTININGALSSGDLAESLSVLQGSLDAALVAQPLPIMLIIAFGLVMVLQIGRLITDDRRSETALLKSRGLAARRLAGWAAVEAVAFAVPGAGLGLIAAAFVSGVPAAGWWTALAAVLVALIACVIPAWRDGRATLMRSRIDDSGRGRGAVAGGVLALLAAAAAFAVWRFRRSGADAVTIVDGRRVLDPAVLLAPPVTLVALAAAGLVVFGLVTRAAERSAAKLSSALSMVLPVRQLARRRTVFGAAVMLIAMAVAGLCVAAGYASTTARHQQVTAQLTNGADVKITDAGHDLSAYATFRDPAAGYASLPGVTDAGAVMRLDARAGDTDVTLAGIGAGVLPAVTRPAPQFDPAAQAAAMNAQPATGSVLPDGSSALTLRATIVTGSGGVKGAMVVDMPVTAWLMTPDGALAPSFLGTLKVPLNTTSTLELTTPLPHCRNGTRLVGLDLQVSGNTPDPLTYDTRLDLRATTAAGQRPLVVDGWAVQSLSDSVDTPQFKTAAGRSGFTVAMPINQVGQIATQPANLRLMPAGEASAPVTVVVNQTLADRLNLRAGDRVSLTIPGLGVRAQIGAVVPDLAGFDGGAAVALADLPSLGMTLLRSTLVIPATSQVWLASSDPSVSRQAAADIAGPAAAVTQVGADAVQVLLRPASQALWWGMGGALLLGAVSVLLVMATQSRSRRAESAVLRALGVRAAEQAAMRGRELLAAVLPAWVLGLAAGFGTALLIVPGLARQAVVNGSATQNPPLLVQWPLWLALLAAHVLLVLAAIGWYGVTVRRHAQIADPREVMA